MSRPTTPVKPKAPMDPKITYAPVRKQRDHNPFIMGDYQPIQLVPAGGAGVPYEGPYIYSPIIGSGVAGGAGISAINQLSNNMSSLNINSTG